MKIDLSHIDLPDLIIAVCRRVYFELDREKDEVAWKMIQTLVRARTTDKQRKALRAILEDVDS